MEAIRSPWGGVVTVTTGVNYRGQSYDNAEEAMARIIKLLRVELEATLEAAKRIEELVLRLRAMRARQ
jgi:hypothetical protein